MTYPVDSSPAVPGGMIKENDVDISRFPIYLKKHGQRKAQLSPPVLSGPRPPPYQGLAWRRSGHPRRTAQHQYRRAVPAHQRQRPARPVSGRRPDPARPDRPERSGNPQGSVEGLLHLPFQRSAESGGRSPFLLLRNLRSGGRLRLLSRTGG